MSVFDNVLKNKREKMGYTIEQISDITTIQSRYIKALEDENFDIIPGDYYVRSFLKQYATILKVDSNKLIKQYEIYKATLESTRPDVLLQDELMKPSKASIEVIEETKDVSFQEEVVPEVEESEEQDTMLNEEVTVANENTVIPVVIEDVDIFDEGDDTPDTLDSDGLDEILLEDDSVSIATVESVNSHNDSDNDDVGPVVKFSKKMIAFFIVASLLIIALVLAIPNIMANMAPKQSETVTTTSSVTLASTTTQQTTQATTTTQQTTTTQATTTQQTTQATTTQAPAPQPSNEPADLYIMSSDAYQTTYGLGASFANYTGEYVVTLTASEPVWILVEIFGQKVHEGTMHPNTPYRFNAYNNAGTMKIRVGLSSAVKVTFNDRPLQVPTYNRVQDYTFNFAR